jgi:hypothetical protein
MNCLGRGNLIRFSSTGKGQCDCHVLNKVLIALATHQYLQLTCLPHIAVHENTPDFRMLPDRFVIGSLEGSGDGDGQGGC